MPESKHMSPPVEKEHLDNIQEKGSDLYDILDDQKLVNRIKRKVDLRLLPILGCMYAVSAIDRGNLSNVRISGADKEIGLDIGNHYSIATLVFVIPYIILELPSMILFRRVGASLYLGTTGLLWGVILIAMGFSRTWNQMAALRGLLGILEAGFFPACIWLISCWYPRAEVQVRLAAFHLFAAVAGGFSSAMAYGLSTIRTRHLSGWRWILIVEGIITLLISVLGYFTIVDFPDKNKFLTPEETALIKERVERDSNDIVHDPLTLTKALDYVRDPKIWSFGTIYIGATTAASAHGYFSSIILIGLGFSVRNAQLLVAPTGISAALFALCMSRIADKYQTRGPIVVFQSLMTITGLSLTAFHPNSSVRFAGTLIGTVGSSGNITAILAYQSNNIRRQSKRSFATAFQITSGGFGTIIASVAYRQQDSPRYKLGITVTIALQGMIIFLVGLNSVYFAYRNRQARKGGKPIEDQPGFLYTL